MAWDDLHASAARLFTSVPIVLETFTVLDRNAARDVALAWRESLDKFVRFVTAGLRLVD